MKYITFLLLLLYSVPLYGQYSENYTNIPSVFFNSGNDKIYKVGVNVAGNLDKTGSANNENPWRFTGGTDDCHDKIAVVRTMTIPKDKQIILYMSKIQVNGNTGRIRRMDAAKITGFIPPGSTFKETMYNDSGEVFEVRTLTRTENGWKPDFTNFGNNPKGYVPQDNCTKCHEDIGKHSFEIDDIRDWYGYVRGLEVGGPINWHPFKVPPGNNGIKPEIREELKDYVRWEKS